VQSLRGSQKGSCCGHQAGAILQVLLRGIEKKDEGGEESSELREMEIRLDVGAQVVMPRTHRKRQLPVTQAKASLLRIVMA
jgi:hypothetical protein